MFMIKLSGIQKYLLVKNAPRKINIIYTFIPGAEVGIVEPASPAKRYL